MHVQSQNFAHPQNSQQQQQLIAQPQKQRDMSTGNYDLNSLFAILQDDQSLQFNVIIGSLSSQIGQIGANQVGNDVIQMSLQRMRIPRVAQQVGTNSVDMNQKTELYILIDEFRGQGFVSGYGFYYHFSVLLEDWPGDPTAFLGIPSRDTISFQRPIKFNNRITMKLYTTAIYKIPEQKFDAYVDYSSVNVRIRKQNGEDHNLDPADMLYFDDFNVPNLVSATQPSQPTHRSKWYQISIIDAKVVELPFQFSAAVKASINRPGDEGLGVYYVPTIGSMVPANPASITMSIPHGLITGNYVTFDSGPPQILGTEWRVVVTSATTFEIQFDSTIFTTNQVVSTSSLPISLSRQATVSINIPSRRISTQLNLKTIDENARNPTPLHSVP